MDLRYALVGGRSCGGAGVVVISVLLIYGGPEATAARPEARATSWAEVGVRGWLQAFRAGLAS